MLDSILFFWVSASWGLIFPDDKSGIIANNRYVTDIDVYPDIPGIRFRNTPYEKRINQIYGNTQLVDFKKYYNKIDFVFVDANHHYKYVKKDSENALRMKSPKGFIIWHDYAPYAPGVLKALYETSKDNQIVHFSGTSFACLFPDP